MAKIEQPLELATKPWSIHLHANMLRKQRSRKPDNDISRVLVKLITTSNGSRDDVLDTTINSFMVKNLDSHKYILRWRMWQGSVHSATDDLEAAKMVPTYTPSPHIFGDCFSRDGNLAQLFQPHAFIVDSETDSTA